MELPYDLDRSDDVLVEGGEVFDRDPVLLVRAAADRVDREPAEEVSPHVEAGDVAGQAGGRVYAIPVSGDLDGVFLAERDRIGP